LAGGKVGKWWVWLRSAREREKTCGDREGGFGCGGLIANRISTTLSWIATAGGIPLFCGIILVYDNVD
jgi:hypothetical protein